MGNEASLEGGEGSLSELAEGLSSDGKGGFVQISTGEKVDLSHLSEEERIKLTASVSKGTGIPPGSSRDAATLRASAVAGTGKAPTGLSKSRTIDAFSEGPPLKPKPGRSPSSLSLFESRFSRQEAKAPSLEPKSSMFGSGFLSGANPLSAVSSAVSSSATNISNFNLFGDDEKEQDAKPQGKGPAGPAGQRKGPQQPQGQGPPKSQGAPPQGPPKGQGPPQQGPPKGQGGPPQGGPPKGQGPPQQGPPKGQGGPPQGPPKGQGGPPQQGPPKGQGAPPQQGPPKGQGGPPQGPSKGQGGPPQGPPKGQGAPQPRQGNQPQGPGQPTGPGPAKQAPGPGPQQQKAASPMCPLCKATELNVQAKDQPPNYNTCTQCKQQVCSLCGFSPPDSEGKEWLCLNCQMQRALGGAEPPGPPMRTPQGSAPPSPQRGGPPMTKGDSKRPPMLQKQKSIIDSGKMGTPPITPNLKSPGPLSPNVPLSPKGSLGPGSQPGSQPGSPGPKAGSPNIDPKTGRPLPPPGSPGKSAASQPKQDTGFFGGFGFGGLTDMAKPPAATSQAAESVTGKLFSGFGGGTTTTTKTPASPSQATESVTGKFFGGLGGLAGGEGNKPPAAAAEAVSGKMFGFGSSFLSSATNLISSNQESEDADSPPGSPPDSPIDSGAESPPGSPPDSGADSPPGSPPDSPGSESPPDTPPATSKGADLSEKIPESPGGGTPTVKDAPSVSSTPTPEAPSSCPLCKTELNMNTPNYSTCTECQKTVCSACGFNPAPHLGETEWVCLNCQTQRALSGQLSDIPSSPKPSPDKQPMKHSPKETSPPPSPLSSPTSPVASAPTDPTSKVSSENDPSISQNQAEELQLNSDKPVDDNTSALAEAVVTDEPMSDVKTEEPDLNKAPDTTPEMASAAVTQTPHSDTADTPACSTESVTEAETVGAKNEKNVDDNPPAEQKPNLISSGENETTAAVESASPLPVEESTALQPETIKEESSHSDEHIPEVTKIDEKQTAAEESESLVEQSKESTQPQVNTKVNLDVDNSTPEHKPENTSDGREQGAALETETLLEKNENNSGPSCNEHTSVDEKDLNLEPVGLASGSEQVSDTGGSGSFATEAESKPSAEQLVSESGQDRHVETPITDEQVGNVSENISDLPTNEEASTLPVNETDSTVTNDIQQDRSMAQSENSVLAKTTDDTADLNCTAQTAVDELNSARPQQEHTLTEAVIPHEINIDTADHKRQVEDADAVVPAFVDKDCTTPESTSDIGTGTVPNTLSCAEDQGAASKTEVLNQKPVVELEIVRENETETEADTTLTVHLQTPDEIDKHANKPSTDVQESQSESLHKNSQQNIESLNEENPVTIPEGGKTTSKESNDSSSQQEVANSNISSIENEHTKTEAEKTCVDPTKEAAKLSPEASASDEIRLTVDEMTNSSTSQLAEAVGTKNTENITGSSGLAENDTVEPPPLPQAVLEDTSPLITREEIRKIAENERNDTENSEKPEKCIVQEEKQPEQENCEMSQDKNALYEIKIDKQPQENLEQECPTPTAMKQEANVINLNETNKDVKLSDDSACSKESEIVVDAHQIESSDFSTCVDSTKDISQSSNVDKERVVINAGTESSTVSPPNDPNVEVDSFAPVITSQIRDKDLQEENVIPESNKSMAMSGAITENKHTCGIEPVAKPDSSQATPSEITTLESTVLPILESQTNTSVGNDLAENRSCLQASPTLPKSSSEEHGEGGKQEKVPSTVTVGSNANQNNPEDGGEKKATDSFIAADEQLIQDKNAKMSANEDAVAITEIKDQEEKTEQEGMEKSESGRGRRLLKRSSITPEDDSDLSNLSSPAKPLDSVKEVAGLREQPSENSATVPRDFKTIELNSTTPIRQPSDDGEPESLTDSPEDRSRGEGSSSLHASSFTPGTSPTSLSSLDEDSDSSSPSHTRSSGEGKQHRKAKHRQPGQMLPTIEDSSEEEELREEEELLREQEKQKSSGKKSRKDKEDMRGQRRRDHPKTPPSNLSPIEDASPTEELRQEAEMEEIRRSSCSDFSPSIESEPEGFVVSPEKIVEVQKVYQLPTSVSLYSPTDENITDGLKEGKILKSADEAYEEIMLRAKSPTTDKVELQPCKELVHGSMLIEAYADESVIEDKCEKQDRDEKPVTAIQKQLRSPDEVYEDMMQKKMLLLKEQSEPPKDIKQPDIILPESNSDINSNDGKPLLNAETDHQTAVLTPGTSPTKACSEAETSALNFTTQDNISAQDTGSLKRLYPIPDLRVIQCSSGEEEPDEESSTEIKSNTESQSEESPVISTDKQTAPVVSVAEIDMNSVPLSEKVSSNDNAISSENSDTPSLYVDSHTSKTDQVDVVDLSKSSLSSQTNSSSPSLPSVGTKHAHPVVVSVSPLPTVPQYIPAAPSVVSTAPPVPPKPTALRRGLSQDKSDIHTPPSFPPPVLPKPIVHPRNIPPQVLSCTSSGPIPLDRQTMPGSPAHKPHMPPPVPPKPSTLPAGFTFCNRSGESVKPPLAPKPHIQPPSPIHSQARPTVLITEPVGIALNLSPSVDSRPGTTSPKSPSSPRHTKTVHETYVVITLPSQPSSPVEGIQSQAPMGSGFASPTAQPQPSFPPTEQQQSRAHAQQEPPPQPQPQPQYNTTKVPLAFTRITESIESQEICGPEKVVSSMSHVYEAISASAQPPLANGVTQVVTTELQRTTVSVVHERAPGMAMPRSSGVSSTPENLKTQPQNSHIYHAGEVVDLRTPKTDAEIPLKGVDLSSADLRRQSVATDCSPRQTSAVQPSVVNLSTESPAPMPAPMPVIVTCASTVSYASDASATSLPLQLTTAKSFEPVSQIVYRPVDAQPEKPINLSTTVGKAQTPTGTTAPSSFGASVPPRLEMCVSGAVDLSTAKPAQTMVSVVKSTAEVMTSVVSEEDGKPVDLTASRRAVCCDVVYKLPFGGSCSTSQQPSPLPEDRFGYRDDHYQYDRSPYGMKAFVGMKPSMSETNLADAGLFAYKSKHSFDYNSAIDGAVDLTSGKMSEAGETRVTGAYSGMSIPQFSHNRITAATGAPFVVTSVMRSSNGIVYSSVAAPNPTTYAITTQPGSIFSTTYNSLSGMHTSDTMPSLSSLQYQPITRSQSFVSTLVTPTSDEPEPQPLNLEIVAARNTMPSALSDVTHTLTTTGNIDSYTDSSLEAIAASIEALSSPMVPGGDEQYHKQRELLEREKMKQQRLAEELEWERQEIQRFREQEQFLVQKELEELQVMKQQILCQQEEERQAHLMMQKETYAQQQQQLEQIQRLQEQLRQQLEEQKFRQMYPGEASDSILGVTESRKIMDSGVQTDEEDNTEQAYSSGRQKKRSVKKSVDSSVQTDDEDQDEWDAPARARRSRSRGVKNSAAESGGQLSVQAHTEISVQTDSMGSVKGHSLQLDARVQYSDSERSSSPQRDSKKRPTPLEIGQPSNLTVDPTCLQVAQPKSPKVLYSPISPCVSPSKSLDFVSLGDANSQTIHAAEDLSKTQSANTRAPRVMQRSLSDPKPMSPTGEERATHVYQQTDGEKGKASPAGAQSGTHKKVKRTLPNPPSEEETASTGPVAYSTASARRRLCRSTNMARAKILQDIDKELDLVERESSKLRKKQAELDEEEKEIDAKLRYLEMGIYRRKDALLKEREKRERAYLQSMAEDRDYMSDSEVSNIRETRLGGSAEEAVLGQERPRTAPQSELQQYVPPHTKHEAQYGKYNQYQLPQQSLYHSLYQSPQPYHSQSMYSSIPSLTASQQQSYHQMLLLQQKARQQAALLSELDTTKMATSYDVIRSQPDASSYLGGKYGSHLDLCSLEERGSSIAGTPMSNVSNDSFYADVEHHHSSPRSYLLLEDAADLSKGSSGLPETSYALAEKELAKAERLLRRTAADVGTDYQEDEDSMEEPYELKLLKQQLKQEFRRSHTGTESLEQLAGLSHYQTSSAGVSGSAYRPLSKLDRYSISRLTLEKQAAKQLPSSIAYQKQKAPLMDSKVGKYSSTYQDPRALETDYTSYLGSSSASPRPCKLQQDEITFGLRKNIAEQQKFLGNNLHGGLNIGQSLNLLSGSRNCLGEDSSYPSGSRSRPSSRPTSVYGLDLSMKSDISSSSLRLKAEGETSTDISAYQTPSGRAKPTSLAIGPSGRGRIPIVAQNSEEESPLSPVGQPMGMARASAGPLPPISADSRDQFGSCLSLQDPQQQHLRDEQARMSGYGLMDDLQCNMPESEAYHHQRDDTDWFMKPQDYQHENGRSSDRKQMKSMHFAFPHVRVKLQRDPKDHSVSGNGLGIRVVGGKEVPGSHGDIGAYVAKVLPGGAAEQTGKIVEGMQVLEWNGIVLTGKTYEEVQGLVGQPCEEAEICVRLDLNMLSVSESCSQRLELRDPIKGDHQRSPGVDPEKLAAELQKVSQQQTPMSSVSTGDKGHLTTSTTASTVTGTSSSPAQPSSPSVGKKRHSKTSDTARLQTHPVTGEIQLQINYDKQPGNLIVHVLQARNLSPRDVNGYSDPFVKVYLLPGRGQVMVVQNASAESRRRSKHAQRSQNPEWNQTVIYKNIQLEQLRKKTLEVSVWDYDKCSSNDFLGEVLIDLSNASQLDNVPRWLTLKEQSDGEHHRRGRQHSPKTSGHSSQHSPKKQDSPKSSVTKSRSHGIFPDPAKDTQMPTIEKSHSSPGTSKPSPSPEGQGRSRGSSSHSSSKSGVARTQQQDSVAASDVTPQQRPHHLQPSAQQTFLVGDALLKRAEFTTKAQNGRLSLRYHRHSVVGVLTIQRPLSDFPTSENRDGRHLTLRKAMSEERGQMDRGLQADRKSHDNMPSENDSNGTTQVWQEPVLHGHRGSDAPLSAASLDSGLSGSAYSLLEEESETNAVDSAIFQIPRFGKITNGTDTMTSLQEHGETEGKTHVMGEIKIAMKKEMRSEGEYLVLEILQCRNITYRFKSPDHLPDLYVKLYVVNVATQKRIIKKKTRVCRHDREPSFNETFRFCMNPTGHSLQLFLVSNGGKFVKKTLIGEAYVWLDKVDLRKRVVSWHKLLASSAQIHP